MADKPQQPIIFVRTDERSIIGDAPGHDSSGDDIGPRSQDRRRGVWLIAGITAALLVGALVVNSQLGTDDQTDDSETADARTDSSAEAVDDRVSDESPLPDASTAVRDESEAVAPGNAAADEAPASDDRSTSGIEPYAPSRIRTDELGPPADFCTGALTVSRVQLPLRFANTKPEGIAYLTWSPDCRRMVFRVGSTLWTANGDGTGDMPFIAAQHGLSAPAWSPDAEWIAYSQDAIVAGERTSHIHIVKLDALGLSQVTEGVVLDHDPAWSPDGQRIAFSRRARIGPESDAGEFDRFIVVVDLATGIEQVLTAGGERDSNPGWTPDGKSVTYRSGGSLMAMGIDDLPDSEAPDSPAPDSQVPESQASGSQVPASQVSDSQVPESQLSGSQLSGSQVIVGVVDQGGAWSPDGSRIAAWRGWSNGAATIVVRDLPDLLNRGEQLIPVGAPDAATPGGAPKLHWSIDGQRLIFHVSDVPGNHWSYSVAVPAPARSAQYWATSNLVETAVQAAGYTSLGVEHSNGDEAEFSVWAQADETIVEVSIAFDRSEPTGDFSPLDAAFPNLEGITRGDNRNGVWFSCNNLYVEVLAASPTEATTLATALMSTVCPAGAATPQQ